MTSILDAYEVLEETDCDRILDGSDDSEFFEMDIDESSKYSHKGHEIMWHDFDQINEDDLPY